jgi:phosphomevalonate kinase
MEKVILISGKARHGKDTFAELLKDTLDQKGKLVVVDRFAKYIKSYLRDYYGWDGVTKDEFIRNFLQKKGTEEIKEKKNYKCFHAKRLTEDFDIVQDDFNYFLVPDTRFEDEIYIFKAMFPNKVITVRIERDGVTGGLTKEQLQHKSETALDCFKFDWNVKNNGTLEDLQREVNIFIQHML